MGKPGAAPLLKVQDQKANLRALRNATVERLVLMLATHAERGTTDVLHGLLKVQSGRWHRFFLDVGVLFWEELESLETDDTDLEQVPGTAPRTLVAIPWEGAVLASVGVQPGDGAGVLTLKTTDGRCAVFSGADEGSDNERVTLQLVPPTDQSVPLSFPLE